MPEKEEERSRRFWRAAPVTVHGSQGVVHPTVNLEVNADITHGVGGQLDHRCSAKLGDRVPDVDIGPVVRVQPQLCDARQEWGEARILADRAGADLCRLQ